MNKYVFEADEENAGVRIDKCLALSYEELSRADIQSLIKD